MNSANGDPAEQSGEGATVKEEQQPQEKGSRSKARVKKELRNVDALLKSMNNLSAEDKLQSFCLKYAEIQEENKTFQNNLKAQERRTQVLQREREQLQAENSKGILARNRLEELCRELQRQNKAIKEESMLKIREEEERRKEVATKFQTTLSEVSTLLQQNNDKNNKLREENGEMAQRLQMLCDQYTLREQHLEKLAKQYDIERQLNEAKLAKTRMEFAEDKEKTLREKQQLLLELTEYQKKCQAMQVEEVALRQQLSMYTDKYDDFQKALAQSNKTFGGFKEQMDTMTKKLKNLEKETATWKLRWEKSNKALLDMATEKQQRDALLANTTKQVTQLEKLCRALQTERTSLISQLKEKSGISETVSVQESPAPDPENSTLVTEDTVFVAQNSQVSSAADQEQIIIANLEEEPQPLNGASESDGIAQSVQKLTLTAVGVNSDSIEKVTPDETTHEALQEATPVQDLSSTDTQDEQESSTITEESSDVPLAEIVDVVPEMSDTTKEAGEAVQTS